MNVSGLFFIAILLSLLELVLASTPDYTLYNLQMGIQWISPLFWIFTAMAMNSEQGEVEINDQGDSVQVPTQPNSPGEIAIGSLPGTWPGTVRQPEHGKNKMVLYMLSSVKPQCHLFIVELLYHPILNCTPKYQ